MSGSDQWQIKAKYRARRGCLSVGRAREEGARSACPQHLPFLSSHLREQLRVLAGHALAWPPPPGARHRAPRWWPRCARAATCQQLRGASALQVWPRVQAATPGSWRAPAAACGQRCAEGAASPGPGLPGAAATRADPLPWHEQRLGVQVVELRGGFTLPGVVLAWAAAPCALQALARGSPGAGTRGAAPIWQLPRGWEPPALNVEPDHLQQAK